MSTNEERKQKLLQAGEEHRIAATWMAEHIDDYVQSAANAKIIGKFLDQNGLPFTHENLEEGFVWGKSFGWDFTKSNEPVVAASSVAPAVTATAPVVPAPPSSEPVEEPLPPVPPYMEHIKTKKDALKCPQYVEWLKGKHGHLWKARVDEIMRRGK